MTYIQLELRFCMEYEYRDVDDILPYPHSNKLSFLGKVPEYISRTLCVSPGSCTQILHLPLYGSKQCWSASVLPSSFFSVWLGFPCWTVKYKQYMNCTHFLRWHRHWHLYCSTSTVPIHGQCDFIHRRHPLWTRSRIHSELCNLGTVSDLQDRITWDLLAQCQVFRAFENILHYLLMFYLRLLKQHIR